jgi:hypothetical protein
MLLQHGHHVPSAVVVSVVMNHATHYIVSKPIAEVREYRAKDVIRAIEGGLDPGRTEASPGWLQECWDESRQLHRVQMKNVLDEITNVFNDHVNATRENETFQQFLDDMSRVQFLEGELRPDAPPRIFRDATKELEVLRAKLRLTSASEAEINYMMTMSRRTVHQMKQVRC